MMVVMAMFPVKDGTVLFSFSFSVLKPGARDQGYSFAKPFCLSLPVVIVFLFIFLFFFFFFSFLLCFLIGGAKLVPMCV